MGLLTWGLIIVAITIILLIVDPFNYFENRDDE